MSDDTLTAAIESSFDSFESSTPDPEPDTEPDVDPVEETNPVENDEADVEKTTTEEPDVEAAPKEKTDEDQEVDDLEAQIVKEKPDLKAAGAMPVSRHQAVLTRTRNQHKAEMEAVQTELNHYKQPEMQERFQAIQLAEHRPKAFGEMLLKDSRYAEVADALVAARQQQSPPEAPPPAAPPVSSPPATTGDMPLPDSVAPDGQRYYSEAAAERLRAWSENKSKAEVTEAVKALEEKFQKELEPIKQEREFSQKREQRKEYWRGVLADAEQNWPGFAESKQVIQQELAKPGHEFMTLEEAYRRVVVSKLQPNEQAMREKIRAELLTEMQAPRPTPSPRPGGAPPAAPADPNASPEDRIQNIIEQNYRRAAQR